MTQANSNFGHLFLLLAQTIFRDHTTEQFGLTRLQAMTVNKIYEYPNISMTALAEKIGTTGPQLTRIIASLESRELVQRVHSTTNRRVVTVVSTEQGQQIHAKQTREAEQRLQSKISSLTSEEQSQLYTSLKTSMELLAKSDVLKLNLSDLDK